MLFVLLTYCFLQQTDLTMDIASVIIFSGYSPAEKLLMFECCSAEK